jgi:hypothetical protein
MIPANFPVISAGLVIGSTHAPLLIGMRLESVDLLALGSPPVFASSGDCLVDYFGDYSTSSGCIINFGPSAGDLLG